VSLARDCETCAHFQRVRMSGGGFAPQCMFLLGPQRLGPPTPEMRAVSAWIEADDKASSWEGPDPGRCPGHQEKP
jgi:hypothetical protein